MLPIKEDKKSKFADTVCCYVNRRLFEEGVIDETLYIYANEKIICRQIKKNEVISNGSV